jgi:hypothetical protein
MKKINLGLLINSKGFFPTLFLILINFLIIGVIIYGVFYVNNLRLELDNLNLRLEETKQLALLVKNNKDLLEDKVSTFNEALDQLIPSQESYFQIISALERLSINTGLKLDDYTINIQDTTSEKISFSMITEGTVSQIQNFFKTYNFASGRLIISEKMTLTQNDQNQSLSFDLSMFNAAYDIGQVTDIPAVKEEDVKMMEEVISQL